MQDCSKRYRENVREEARSPRRFLADPPHQKCTTAQFLAFRSVNHKIQTQEINKICLSAFDDKRYLLKDGVHSLAYGHKDIPTRNVDVPAPTQPKSLFDQCIDKFAKSSEALPEAFVDLMKRRLL